MIFSLGGMSSFAQDSSKQHVVPPIFEKLTKAATEFKLDTSAVPDDKITRKIIELRQLRGGFNINEVMEFKIEEDRQKKNISNEEADKMAAFFSTGNGRRWLDNAVIWIYRKTYTYGELNQMVKFYKTTAGQKMASEFPVVLLQTVRAAEMIKEFK